MNAYEEAERILLDKYAISSSSKNKKEGPLVVGKIKGKCIMSYGTTSKEFVHIPRFAHKYKFLFVVFCKHKDTDRRSDKFDDIYVYEISEIRKVTGRSFGTHMMKSLPLSLDIDEDFRKYIK